MTNNIHFFNRETIHIDDNVQIGQNVTIYGNNYILGNTVIGDNCILMPNNYILDCVLENDVTIHNSVCESAYIKAFTKVGPYSRLRPNTFIGENCKIGNFVEVKNSTIGKGTKASHLAYIGDADIGQNCNIGCGAIFVNYNGKEKNRSVVGNNVFIGSNVNVIAPVNVADGTYICAGTTLTKDTEENDFVIGRERETIKHNYLKFKNKG